MNNMTALEWLEQQLKDTYDKEGKLPLAYTLDLVRQAKEMDKDERKKLIEIVYNIGYTDAQCNHVNDADNLAHEIDYMQSQIDDTPESNCEYSGLPSVKSYENKQP